MFSPKQSKIDQKTSSTNEHAITIITGTREEKSASSEKNPANGYYFAKFNLKISRSFLCYYYNYKVDHSLWYKSYWQQAGCVDQSTHTGSARSAHTILPTLHELKIDLKQATYFETFSIDYPNAEKILKRHISKEEGFQLLDKFLLDNLPGYQIQPALSTPQKSQY